MRLTIFEKAGRAVVHVIMANASLSCEKFLHGGQFRCIPIACLDSSNKVEISRNEAIDFSGGLCTRGCCRFSIWESGLLLFGESVPLSDAEPSPIAAVISELMGDSVFCTCHAMGSVVSMCRFGPAEGLGAASKCTGWCKRSSVSLIEAMVTSAPVLTSDVRGHADVFILRNLDVGAWAECIAAIAMGGVLATLSALKTGVAVFGVILLRCWRLHASTSGAHGKGTA